MSFLKKIADACPGTRARVVVGLMFGLIVLAAIPVVDQFVFRYQWAAQSLDEIEARYARLLGVTEAAPQLASALEQVRSELERYAYPAELGADRIAAELQQRVRTLADGAGVSLVGSQSLPPRPGEGFEVIPLAATLDADVVALHNLLLALDTARPSIRVESIVVTVSRQRRPVADASVTALRVQLNLGAIRFQP